MLYIYIYVAIKAKQQIEAVSKQDILTYPNG